MNMKNYPDNQEITKIRKAVIELERLEDWGALMFAKHDLQSLLKKRDQWVKENNIFKKIE